MLVEYLPPCAASQFQMPQLQLPFRQHGAELHFGESGVGRCSQLEMNFAGIDATRDVAQRVATGLKSSSIAASLYSAEGLPLASGTF
ncbi:hypothetical protein ACIBCB_13380 [Streptomyces uncialis]|uniref:hypothetical protein n=1 Tax=Streptomyces uncialis TaxID=1048205 RepID=UPI002E34FB4F|nr:hypothetical protein [Streptomyces uncialis]